MTSERFHALFGGAPRKPEELLDQRHMDLAASIQKATEEIVLRLARSAAKETGSANLCLAGGVALNCVANGKILRDGASRISGFSLRPVTPAARWGPRSRHITSSTARRGRQPAAATACPAPISGRTTRKPISKRA